MLEVWNQGISGAILPLKALSPRGVQPAAPMQLRMAMNTAQYKIVNLFKTMLVILWLHVTMYLMCNPRQLFFQCGRDTPKVSTPLKGEPFLLFQHLVAADVSWLVAVDLPSSPPSSVSTSSSPCASPLVSLIKGHVSLGLGPTGTRFRMISCQDL